MVLTRTWLACLLVVMALTVPQTLGLNPIRSVRSEEPPRFKLCGNRLASLVISLCQSYGGIGRKRSGYYLNSFNDTMPLTERSKVYGPAKEHWNLVVLGAMDPLMTRRRRRRSGDDDVCSDPAIAQTKLRCICCPTYNERGCTKEQLLEFCQSSTEL
ncbi:uncharacterized protein LOC111265868 [Varroa jacobsoni]|uniref:Uncharacterized protein n=1 Tax=Varroa destructor TaxID=109461 RepID=A0A7M7K0Q2_VARDE|nr:uncharacterized protein LOC111249492 [Varroa destructor]XP_022698591.1 uncharacterized protein LOC111265868 [Varroa jacobsoni]